MQTIEWKLAAEVDGTLVTASWSRHGLMCTPAVLERCIVLIQLDPIVETVCGPIPTSIDGESWHVLVTVIGAVDRVFAADWRPAADPQADLAWHRLEVLPFHSIAKE